MKHNVLALFSAFAVAALILAFLFNSSLESFFDENMDKEPQGQYLVNANDIIKSAVNFLENGNNKKLSDALDACGYGLALYDMDGKVLYDSLNKDNIGRRADLSSITARADPGLKFSTFSYSINMNKQYAVAIIDTHQRGLKLDEAREKASGFIWVLCGIFILYGTAVFIYVNSQILRPFKRLEHVTGEIARGNLDVPLNLERRNLFGAFTWAFDMMRRELKASREKEKEAEQTKKELVAALSHDIRTPVASIRAYAECLKSLGDKNSGRGEHYLDVIMNKTDEITRLSQDMFMHAIMDLEKLEMVPGEYKSRKLLNNLLEPLLLQYENRIIITEAIPDVTIFTDGQRLAQVFENIIANSSKYAPRSRIHIKCYIQEGMLVCCFRDFGDGVLPEDLPFIFDKFFRGKNAKESGQPGSGLGLYISKYILEKTKGQIKARNWKEDGGGGFAVEVSLRIV